MNEAGTLLKMSPESAGISSAYIMELINELADQQINMHGFIMIRHNHVIAEGYWKPFDEHFMHRMYSCSKSFVSTAIGLMIDEGRLSLSDKIADYFPEYQPEHIDPRIAGMTIRNLLTMATANDGANYSQFTEDWNNSFFNTPANHLPGTFFHYDTGGSNCLAALVEKLNGMPFLEYMRPKILDPIGFSKDSFCIQNPDGYSFGGSGVICTTRDLARLALVWLNKGRYEGRQLISEQYVKAASSKQIDTDVRPFADFNRNSGYGYQVWMMRDHGFAFKGMGSQLAICLPDRDFLFVCTADTQSKSCGDDLILDTLWRCVINRMTDQVLTEDPAGHAALESQLADLDVLLPEGAPSSPFAAAVNGKTYILEPNRMGISRVKFDFNADDVLFSYTNEQGDKQLKLGLGRYVMDRFPQRGYSGRKIRVPSEQGYQCLNAATWVENHKLQLTINAVDLYFGNLTAIFSFQENAVSVYMVPHAEWFFTEYNGFAAGYAQP